MISKNHNWLDVDDDTIGYYYMCILKLHLYGWFTLSNLTVIMADKYRVCTNNISISVVCNVVFVDL